jgi:chromosomal replication initiation ATPase DnaA
MSCRWSEFWGSSHYKTNYVPIKFNLLSNNPLWLKVIERFKKRRGEATTASWLSKLDFEIVDQETVRLSSGSKFICNYIEDNYLNELKTIFEEVNPKVDNIILNYEKEIPFRMAF